MPELTPPERTLLASAPQTALVEWYLALAPYGDATFTARVDDLYPGILDIGSRVIPYDGDVGEGTVEPGMTLWVGSAPGLYDEGRVRIRSIDTVLNEITVAENDDIGWTDDLYLTCPGATGLYEIWSVYPRMTEVGGVVTFYNDYDVTFTDEGDHLPPKANAGPPVVVWMNDDGYVDVEFIGCDSFATEIGQTLLAWNWVFPGGDPAISNLEGTRSNPITVRFTTPGFRYVRLQVTDSLATVNHIMLPVWVFQEGVVEPYKKVEVLNQSGTRTSGWRSRLRVFDVDGDTIYNFPDGALCVLFTKTWYGDPACAVSADRQAGRERADIGKYLDPADEEQGALTYLGESSFQDTGQDFADWQRLAGDSRFLILVDNTDGTQRWGYLGGAFGVGHINVTVRQDIGCTTPGWNGTDGTPSAYRIWEASTAPDDIGRGNIRFTGWLSGESLRFDFERGHVDFDAVSHDGVMRRLPAFAFTLEDEAVPTDWYQMLDLCVDRALLHLLEYHSTCNQVCHLNIVGEWNTRTVAIQPFPDTSLYAQAQEHLLKDAQCLLLSDRQGILRATFDPQMLSPANRDTIPVTCDIDAPNWRDEIEEARRHVPVAGSVRASGFHYETPLLSLAPGDAPLQQESEVELDGCILTGQAEANLWSGLHLGKLNNPYPAVPLGLSGYWPVLDPAYGEWFRLTADDPLNRHDLDKTRFLPTEVKFNDSSRERTCLVDLTAAMEAPVWAGITQIVPPPPDPEPNPPPPPPVYPVPHPDIMVIHSRARVFRTNNWDVLNPDWTEVTGALNGVIYAVEMDQGSRGCWATTGTDNNIGDCPNGDQGAGVGVWWTDDITVAIPLWVLVLSQAAAFTLVGAGGGNCGWVIWNPCWGQLRSICPIGPARVVVGEAKPLGLYGMGLGHFQCSHLFDLQSDGTVDVLDPEVWRTACFTCSPGPGCHASAPFMINNIHLPQEDAGLYMSCHQLSLSRFGYYLAAGSRHYVSPSNIESCYCRPYPPPPPCPAPCYEDFPLPYPNGPKGIPGYWYSATDAHQGSRHAVDAGGITYGVAAGDAGVGFGTLYDGTSHIIAEDLYDNDNFVNIASGFTHIYYCRPAVAPHAGENEVMQLAIGNLVPTSLEIYSGDLFGVAGVGYDVGLIGHIRCLWTDTNRLVVVRKDAPDVGQPNLSIVWLCDPDTGNCYDKTGNLPGNWYGTGRRLPAFAWGFRLDNVGCTAPGMPLR